jgi:RsmE family RNA methyltransferase
MRVSLERDPPPVVPLRLILALPRPKVVHRIVADASSMGIKEIDLINSWRVEKSYWSSPLLSHDRLNAQARLGLEQAGDTVMPDIRLHRFFCNFVRDVLPAELGGRVALLADPSGEEGLPQSTGNPVTLALGPEGGFIEREIASFREVGFTTVSLGARILRAETALPYLMGRLF